jgi:hypothetical protein
MARPRRPDAPGDNHPLVDVSTDIDGTGPGSALA